MDLTELSMQVARVDERTQIMHEEIHSSFSRLEEALVKHIGDDEKAYQRISRLEHIVARGKGAWRLVVGVTTVVGGALALAYYAINILHGG